MGRPDDDNEFGLGGVQEAVKRAHDLERAHESHGFFEKAWSFTEGAAYGSVIVTTGMVTGPMGLQTLFEMDPRLQRVRLAAERSLNIAPGLMIDVSLGIGQNLIAGVLPMLGNLAMYAGGGAIVGGAIGAVGGLGVLDEATIPGGILAGFEIGLMIGGLLGLKDILMEGAKRLHVFIEYSIEGAEIAWYAGEDHTVSVDRDINAAAKLIAVSIAELWWVLLQALIFFIMKKVFEAGGKLVGNYTETPAFKTAMADAMQRSAKLGKGFTTWFSENFPKIKEVSEARTRKLQQLEEGDKGGGSTNNAKPKPTSGPRKLQDMKGEVDEYGELKKTTGDGSCDRDHQPSKAALLERATQLKGEELTPAEKARIINDADAVVVPKNIHIAGDTYGGKNTPAQISADASDLAGAASRDADNMVQNAQTMDPENLSKYQQAAAQIKSKTNADYDNWLNDELDQ